MFTKCVTTKDQGNIGVSSAINYFTVNCNTVSIPLNDSQDYDLVVDIDNVLSKVQVKTTKQISKSGFYMVSLRSCGGTKGTAYSYVKDSNCSLVFILCNNGDRYLLPLSKIAHNSSTLTLNDDYFDYLLD